MEANFELECIPPKGMLVGKNLQSIEKGGEFVTHNFKFALEVKHTFTMQ